MPLVLATLLSATMGYWSSGVRHVWWLAWLAPVPLLVVLPGVTAGRASLAAFSATVLAALNIVFAYPVLPAAVRAEIVGEIALASTLVFLAWRFVARRLGAAASIVAYPALATAAEFLGSLRSPHGSAGAVGYSQAAVLPLIQFASLAGVHGVSMLVSLGAAAIAEGWRRRGEPGARLTALMVAGVPLGLVLLYGTLRLREAPSAAPARIGLLADDRAIRLHRSDDSSRVLPLVRSYASRARDLAARGATIVVLPEKMIGVTPGDSSEVRRLLAEAARAGQLTLVAGINVMDSTAPRNRALVFGPDGREFLDYDKRHMVPGLEDEYRIGRGPGLLAGDGVGVAICKDMDFIPLGREYARAGTRLLLVPAWDFTTDAWMHSRMAIVRGVEGGFSVARSAAQGVLTLSDAYGRVVLEVPSGSAAATGLGNLVPGPGGTWFSRIGNWLAWGAVLAGILLLMAAARRRPAA